jgi:transcriptional regulator with XRE-family HTH domain
MDIKQKIGNRLKGSREALNLKLKDVIAGIDELSISRLSNYEQGERMLPVDIAIKLEQKLQVPAAYLLTLTDTKVKPDVIKTEIERQLLMFFRNISEDHQDSLISYANGLYSLDNPHDKSSNPIKQNIKHHVTDQ